MSQRRYISGLIDTLSEGLKTMRQRECSFACLDKKVKEFGLII